MVEFMARIRDGYGVTLGELDLGGGLGIAYTADHEPSSIADFAEVTTTGREGFFYRHNLPLPRLLVNRAAAWWPMPA